MNLHYNFLQPLLKATLSASFKCSGSDAKQGKVVIEFKAKVYDFEGIFFIGAFSNLIITIRSRSELPLTAVLQLLQKFK